MLLKQSLLNLAFCAVGVVISMQYTNYVSNKAQNEVIDYLNSTPQIKTLDTTKLIADLLDDGMGLEDVSIYSDLYLQILEYRGYIVLDQKQLLINQPSSKTEIMTYSQVKKIADKLGFTPRSDYKKVLQEQQRLLSFFQR